jgi:glycerol-3-phosphate dehydrogenase (NAD(P)+)
LIGAEYPGQPPLAVISGPTFAAEVARGLPTAVTVAANDAGFAAALSARLHNERFRVYTSGDIVGVEIGGAVKNVLAIAAGIADGLGFGANTRAALVTRGLAEITRLGVALGGRRETFMGLAGLGDLVLTCTDDQSRNRRLGLALGRGLSLIEASAEIAQVIEGVETAREVAALTRAHGIDMPIALEVYRVLHEGKDPRAAVKALFGREQKAEDLA